MTLNQTGNANALRLDSLIASLRHGLVIAGRVALGAFIIMAAGILAVATAVAGLAIAAVALVMGLMGRAYFSRRASTRARRQAGASMTLEAHRTARGWTVE